MFTLVDFSVWKNLPCTCGRNLCGSFVLCHVLVARICTEEVTCIPHHGLQNPHRTRLNIQGYFPRGFHANFSVQATCFPY